MSGHFGKKCLGTFLKVPGYRNHKNPFRLIKINVGGHWLLQQTGIPIFEIAYIHNTLDVFATLDQGTYRIVPRHVRGHSCKSVRALILLYAQISDSFLPPSWALEARAWGS